MSEGMFRLPDEHLEKAKEIAGRHRTRRSCKVCYERGWTGVAQDNTIVLCHKCVDAEKAFADWKEHVAAHADLKAEYAELFEDPAEDGQENPA